MLNAPICSIDMMDRKRINKRRLRNDVLLIGGLLLAAALGALYLFFFRGAGDTVQVTVDGKPYASYPLSQDRVEEIRTGAQGEQLNRLVISNGEAFVEEATCPDGICAAHRAIRRDGESIVCLPHRVVITVSATAEDGPDAVA
ncbi:MAG: NusG domain II-containing protein [Clostridia bacterium]|nr:NusG domain II-containing protein [Clostridia bacterium]